MSRADQIGTVYYTAPEEREIDLGPASKRWIWIDWCEKHISPKQYWIHTMAGGAGWKIVLNNRRTILTVADDFDDKLLTFAILQLANKPNG